LGRCSTGEAHATSTRYVSPNKNLKCAMKNVMFVCQDNSYSQIAEAWMRDFVGDRIFVASAGLAIAKQIPNFVRVMNEVDIDISDNEPKLLSDYHPYNFDAVISLCTMSMRLPEQWMMCRFFDEWIVPQPEEESSEAYRYIRDDIRDKVKVFLRFEQ
jgi:arsenate reductase (thioredoxin)